MIYETSALVSSPGVSQIGKRIGCNHPVHIAPKFNERGFDILQMKIPLELLLPQGLPLELQKSMTQSRRFRRS